MKIIIFLCIVATVYGQNCVDQSQFCSSWAAQGECEKNPGYMVFNCPYSCHNCPSTIKPGCPCVDSTSFYVQGYGQMNCNDWKNKGWCLRPQSKPTCAVTCGYCAQLFPGKC